MSGGFLSKTALIIFSLLALYVSKSSSSGSQSWFQAPESMVSSYSEGFLNYASYNTFGWKRREPKADDPAMLLTKKQHLNMDTAKKAAHFASIAYCYKLDAVVKWNCTRCQSLPEFVITHTVTDESWDVHGYLGFYPPWKAKIVAFRGTDNSQLRNWLENVRTTQHHVRLDIPGLEDCMVHNGFSRVWNHPFKKKVLAAVQELNEKYGKDGPLYVIGHSAGAATAQLAALSIKMLIGIDDIHLYTFGSPRVGNKAFAHKLAQYMKESWRFTHMRDIVPTLPWMTMGFWHVGQEVFQFEKSISKQKVYTGYKSCDGSGEDPSCHNSMCPLGFGCSSVSDHVHYMDITMENDSIC